MNVKGGLKNMQDTNKARAQLLKEVLEEIQRLNWDSLQALRAFIDSLEVTKPHKLVKGDKIDDNA